MSLVTPCLLYWQEEMSGESVVSSAVPAAATRTTSFKGTSPSSKYVKLNVGGALYYTTMQTLTKQDTMLKAMFSGRMEVLTDSEGKSTVQALGTGLWPRGFILVQKASGTGAIVHTAIDFKLRSVLSQSAGSLDSESPRRPDLVWGVL